MKNVNAKNRPVSVLFGIDAKLLDIANKRAGALGFRGLSDYIEALVNIDLERNPAPENRRAV
jgi:hypothetical protein